MDKHTLAIFGGIVVAFLVLAAVLALIPNYGTALEDGLYKTGDKLLDKADIETFEMIVEAPEHGIIEIKNKEITSNGNYLAVADEVILFDVTPNNGYRFSRLVVKYAEDSFTLYPSDGYKFVAPKGDFTVQAFFEPI